MLKPKIMLVSANIDFELRIPETQKNHYLKSVQSTVKLSKILKRIFNRTIFDPILK